MVVAGKRPVGAGVVPGALKQASAVEVELKQYLTEALDKLEETKKALAQSNNELNQARKQAASFKAYIDELQKSNDDMFTALQQAAQQEDTYKKIIAELKLSLSPQAAAAAVSAATSPLSKAQATLDSIIAADWRPPDASVLPSISESFDESFVSAETSDATSTTRTRGATNTTSPQCKRSSNGSPCTGHAGAVVGSARLLELQQQVKSLRSELRRARAAETTAAIGQEQQRQICRDILVWLQTVEHSFDSWKARLSWPASVSEKFKVEVDVVTRQMMQRVGISLGSFLRHLERTMTQAATGNLRLDVMVAEPVAANVSTDLANGVGSGCSSEPLISALTVVAAACDEMAHVAYGNEVQRLWLLNSAARERVQRRVILAWQREARLLRRMQSDLRGLGRQRTLRLFLSAWCTCCFRGCAVLLQRALSAWRLVMAVTRMYRGEEAGWGGAWAWERWGRRLRVLSKSRLRRDEGFVRKRVAVLDSKIVGGALCTLLAHCLLTSSCMLLVAGPLHPLANASPSFQGRRAVLNGAAMIMARSMRAWRQVSAVAAAQAWAFRRMLDARVVRRKKHGFLALVNHKQDQAMQPEAVRAIALSTRTFIMWCAALQALRMLRHKRAQIEVKVKHQQILMLGQLVRRWRGDTNAIRGAKGLLRKCLRKSVALIVMAWRRLSSGLVEARVLLDRRVQIRLVSILRAWYGYAEKLRNEMCQRKVVEDAAAAAAAAAAEAQEKQAEAARRRRHTEVEERETLRGWRLVAGCLCEWALQTEQRQASLIRRWQWWSQHRMAWVPAAAAAGNALLRSRPTAAQLWLQTLRSASRPEETNEDGGPRVPKSLLSLMLTRWATSALAKLKRQASMIIKFCGASSRMRHESRTSHQADSPASMSMPSPSMPSPRFSILRPSAEDKSESPITAAERGVAQAMSALGIKKPSVNTCTGEGLMRQELRDPSPDPGPFMCDDPAERDRDLSLEDLSFESLTTRNRQPRLDSAGNLDAVTDGSETARIVEAATEQLSLSLARLGGVLGGSLPDEKGTGAGQSLARLDSVVGASLHPVEYWSPGCNLSPAKSMAPSVHIRRLTEGDVCPDSEVLRKEGGGGGEWTCGGQDDDTPGVGKRLTDSASTSLLTPRMCKSEKSHDGGDANIIQLAAAAIRSPDPSPLPQLPPLATSIEPHPSQDGASQAQGSFAATWGASEQDFQAWLKSLKTQHQQSRNAAGGSTPLR